MPIFWPVSGLPKSSLFDGISIRRLIDATFLNSLSSTNQSASSPMVIHFEISIPFSCPPEGIDHPQE
jgi:hypothetical protein